jgi:hypothetical protein
MVKCNGNSYSELLVCELHYVTETSLLVAFHQFTKKYISPDFSQLYSVVTVVWYTNRITWLLDLSND